MQQVLSWLDGRKAIIYGILSLVFSFLVTVHKMSPELGTLLQSIITLLGGGAHKATEDMLGANKLGLRK